MRKISLLISTILYSQLIYSQILNIDWENLFQGNNTQKGYTIQSQSDNGFIISGFTNSYTGDFVGTHGPSGSTTEPDIWVAKTSNLGIIEWHKCLGGTSFEGSSNGSPSYIINTSDNGFIAATSYSTSNDGDVTGNHGGGDIWIVKINNTGNIVWQKCLGGSNTEKLYDIQPTNDGGCIIAAHTNSNDGNISDGNYHNNDAWIIKIDNSGNINWQHFFGGSNNDFILSIKQTSEGNYICVGGTESNDGNVVGWHEEYSSVTGFPYSDAWIIKLNSSGNIVWQKCLGGYASSDKANKVIETTDNYFIITGSGGGTNDGDFIGTGNFGTFITKLDSSGNVQWLEMTGFNPNYKTVKSIRETLDGNIATLVVNGSSVGKNSLVKIDKTTGNQIWEQILDNNYFSLSSPPSNENYLNDFDITSDNGFLTIGTKSNGIWITKLSIDALSIPSLETQNLKLYPNPVPNILTISKETIEKVTITDLTGKKVFTQNNSNKIDISDLQKGIYLVTIETNDGKIETQKIIKE